MLIPPMILGWLVWAGIEGCLSLPMVGAWPARSEARPARVRRVPIPERPHHRAVGPPLVG